VLLRLRNTGAPYLADEGQFGTDRGFQRLQLIVKPRVAFLTLGYRIEKAEMLRPATLQCSAPSRRRATQA